MGHSDIVDKILHEIPKHPRALARQPAVGIQRAAAAHVLEDVRRFAELYDAAKLAGLQPREPDFGKAALPLALLADGESQKVSGPSTFDMDAALAAEAARRGAAADGDSDARMAEASPSAPAPAAPEPTSPSSPAEPSHVDELTRSVEKSQIRDDDAARRALGFDAAADDEDMVEAPAPETP